VFLVGVGGGVPHYTDESRHVRLGDVVVSHPGNPPKKYALIYNLKSPRKLTMSLDLLAMYTATAILSARKQMASLILKPKNGVPRVCSCSLWHRKSTTRLPLERNLHGFNICRQLKLNWRRRKTQKVPSTSVDHPRTLINCT
jgi:hypothetical protein